MSRVYNQTFDEQSGNQLTDATCPECEGRIRADGNEPARSVASCL